MTISFSLTYDYLCPFARNANEAVVEMIKRGDDLDVMFAPFSLSQNHNEDGDAAQWDRETDDYGSGVLALLWSLAVREKFAESFLDFHVALFSARHDRSEDIGDTAVLGSVAHAVGLDVEAVSDFVASGAPAEVLKMEHTSLVVDYNVFGVPTFIQDGEAVFVRFMERHGYGDITRVLDMMSVVNINEFKRPTVDR